MAFNGSLAYVFSLMVANITSLSLVCRWLQKRGDEHAVNCFLWSCSSPEKLCENKNIKQAGWPLYSHSIRAVKFIRSGDHRGPHDVILPSHEMKLVQYCDMLGITRSYIVIFSLFWTANFFPTVKLCQNHVSSNMIHFSSSFNNFLLHFYYLTSELIAPSSGLKSQLIFIILWYKKVSLYLQHFLRIYLIKYRYLVSMNQYNINMPNIVISRCIDFFPHH